MRAVKMKDRKITLDLGEANPKQAAFYASRTMYTAYGGAKGGGKTHAVRTKAVGGAIRYPGIRILIVRRTYPELQSGHVEPMLKLVPREAAKYNASAHTLYFYNGSVIRFGHFLSGVSENEYQGQEYDWIFIDEATQFTEREFRFLGGCLRGTAEVPKRFYLTCNPGGVGHSWVKRLFVERRFNRSGDPERDENPDDYLFIRATVEDNEHLARASPGYLKLLSSLPENIRRAYRYGDWDALGGAYFGEFSAGRHVIRPFKIPGDWLRYRAFDYGLDMLACLWIACAPDGRCYVYREVKEPGLIVSEAARRICEMTGEDEDIVMTFAPPDMWSRAKDTGRTMAELFMQAGVPVVRASSSRVQGHMMIKEMLYGQDGGCPGLLFFANCREMAGDVAAIQADENHPNDCAKRPHDVTHTVDALRYFCVSRSARPAAVAAEEGEERDGIGYEEFMLGR